MRFLSVVAVAATLALGATACGTDTGTTPAGGGDPARTLPSGTWVLTAGEDPDGPLALVPTHPVTLEVGPRDGSGPQVGGRVCNSYFAEPRAAGDGPLLEGPGSTEMACLEDGVMELESRYLGALARVDTVATSGDDDRLELTGDGVRLTYEPAAPVEDADLAGGRWVVQTIVDGGGPDASASSGSGETSFRFRDGGGVEVRSCNPYSGVWDGTASSGTVELTQSGVYDALPCDAVRQAETDVVAALFERAGTWSIEGDQLTITAADGKALVLTR